MALTMSPPMTQNGSFHGSVKRTFKEKLNAAVLEATEQEQMAMREAQLLDKKTLAISMLLEGRPQAFADFFNLTHGRLGTTSTSGREEAELPQESLLLLKAQLAKADAAKAEGKMEEVCNVYKSLAKYFTELGRLAYAEFFLKQAVILSQAAKWVQGEIEAQHALGIIYEQMQDSTAAAASHEKRLGVATINSLKSDIESALRSLTSVYLRQAEADEKAGATTSALVNYKKCLSAAERAGEDMSRALAHFRMGMLHFGASNWHDAIFHLRQFIEGGALVLGDKVAEGLAHTALAQSLRENSDVEGSVALLEGYLGNAQRGGDQNGPAMACCSLGTVYYDKGDHGKAVSYFERFFEIARTLNDRKMLDTARFNLGVARGALRMGEYMALVNQPDLLPKLIQWKNARVPFF